MQKKVYLLIVFLLFSTTSLVLAQKSLRFSQTQAPKFYMGETKQSLQANYNHLVLTFVSGIALSEIATELEIKHPELKVSAIFYEYNAIDFSYQGSQNRQTIKALFQTFQERNDLASITPYYQMESAQVFYFDLLNFKRKVNISEADALNALQKFDVEFLIRYESKYPGGISFARVPKGESVFKLARKLHATGLFEFIYPMSNRIVEEDYIPNDSEFNDQWHLRQDNDADIDATEAWDLTTGNSNLVIAIQELDGFDVSHPDLAPNVVAPYNAFLDVNNAQFLDNAHTHGTRVAGCSSAVTDNNMGVSGVAFNLKVMPIILTDVASNSVNDITLQRAADHIIANGNVVAVNNSWSGSAYDAGEDAQFQRMRTLSRGGLGSVILGSTGNYSNTQIRYPACYKNVVGVGRTTEADFRFTSSNYHDSVDVSAPGSSILTTDVVGSVGAAGDYTTASGTSFSTPITAGVVGLMASINGNLSGEDLKNYLEQSCEKVGNYPYHPVLGRPNGIWHEELGYGRVNALHAVLLADATVPSNQNCASAISLSQISPTQFCYSNASLNGASASLPPLNCSGSTSTLAQDIWFEFTAVNSSMSVSVNPLGTELNPVVAVYSSCNGNLIACINAAEGNGFSETLSLTGLSVNQAYYVQVYHYSENGQGPSSFNFDICAYVPAGTCAEPIGLLSTNISDDAATLQWSAAVFSNNYEVALRPQGGTTWTSFLTTGNIASVGANELACNTIYEWKVRSLCDVGVSTWSLIANFTTSACQECAKPINLMASSITSTSAVLSWEAAPPSCFIDGFDGDLYQGTASNGVLISNWSDISSISFNATGLQANTTYTFRVRQDCDCGGLVRSIYVYYSFTTPSASPIDLQPVATASSLAVNGNDISVNASYENTGIANAGSHQVAYYLSKSPYFTSFDYLLGTETVSTLGAGAVETLSYAIDLCNESIPDGTYYLGYYLDQNQNVAEDNEVNNFLFWPDQAIELTCSTPANYLLTLGSSEPLGGTVSGGGVYTDGALATIQAIPSPGWEFIDWTENGVEFSTSASSFVLMDSDKTLVANFGALTSILSLNGNAQFSFYPNPSDGKFHLDLSSSLKGASCELYTISGQLLSRFENLAVKNELRFEGAPGMYFLHLIHPEYQMKPALLQKR